MEQTDFEDIHSLQFLQWSVPQFCMAILEKILPCLKTTNQGFVIHALQLLHRVAALLKESVDAEALWTDHSVPAREMVSNEYRIRFPLPSPHKLFLTFQFFFSN